MNSILFRISLCACAFSVLLHLFARFFLSFSFALHTDNSIPMSNRFSSWTHSCVGIEFLQVVEWSAHIFKSSSVPRSVFYTSGKRETTKNHIWMDSIEIWPYLSTRANNFSWMRHTEMKWNGFPLNWYDAFVHSIHMFVIFQTKIFANNHEWQHLHSSTTSMARSLGWWWFWYGIWGFTFCSSHVCKLKKLLYEKFTSNRFRLMLCSLIHSDSITTVQ